MVFRCLHLLVILLLRFFRFVQNVCNLLCLLNKHYDDHVYLHEIQNDNIIFANLLRKKDDLFHHNSPFHGQVGVHTELQFYLIDYTFRSSNDNDSFLLLLAEDCGFHNDRKVRSLLRNTYKKNTKKIKKTKDYKKG